MFPNDISNIRYSFVIAVSTIRTLAQGNVWMSWIELPAMLAPFRRFVSRSGCVPATVCVCERERERENVHVCVSERIFAVYLYLYKLS